MAARYGAVIYPVEFDDQRFAHYATLGGCLGSRTKRSASVTALMFPRVGDVPVAVLDARCLQPANQMTLCRSCLMCSRSSVLAGAQSEETNHD
jgi:hypothetical protein